MPMTCTGGRARFFNPYCTARFTMLATLFQFKPYWRAVPWRESLVPNHVGDEFLQAIGGGVCTLLGIDRGPNTEIVVDVESRPTPRTIRGSPNGTLVLLADCTLQPQVYRPSACREPLVLPDEDGESTEHFPLRTCQQHALMVPNQAIYLTANLNDSFRLICTQSPDLVGEERKNWGGHITIGVVDLNGHSVASPPPQFRFCLVDLELVAFLCGLDEFPFVRHLLGLAITSQGQANATGKH